MLVAIIVLVMGSCMGTYEVVIYIVAKHIAAIVPTTEEGRAISVVSVSRYAWLFEVCLHHSMALGNELKDD